MATYRLFPATNGPATATARSGNFISGVTWTVTQGGMWFTGYWWWVCNTGQTVTPVKCALWSLVNGTNGLVVPGSVVTSGALTVGTWNYIPLANPVQIAIGDTLVAAIGVNGAYPDTPNSFGAGQTYANGITNGPLRAFSAPGGGYPSGWGNPQGCMSTAGSDPSTAIPLTVSGTDNLWVGVQVSDTAVPTYTGTWRLWPHMASASAYTQPNTTDNLTVGTEIDITARATVNNIWFYSPAGTAQLPTEVSIWTMTQGGLNGTAVVDVVNPTWSGTAGSGWISTPVPGNVVLPVGKYRVSVYNDTITPDQWSAFYTGYWGVPAGQTYPAPGASGIVAGPMTAPATANAQTAFSYNGAGATEPGQSLFAYGPPNTFPNFYIGVNSPGGALFQNYWVDLEVTTVIITVAGTATVAIAPLSVRANGVVVVTGRASITVGPVLIAATVTTVIGNASVVVGGVNVAANGRTTVVGTARVALGALAVQVTGHTIVVGHASIVVGPILVVAARVNKVFTRGESVSQSTVTATLHKAAVITTTGPVTALSSAAGILTQNLAIPPGAETGTGTERIDALTIQAALLSHFLDTYVVPDAKNWEVENERARHDQALYRLGEYAIFVLMWQMQDFTLGLVGRCTTCMIPQGALADTWAQPAYFKCPNCYGSGFEGGYKAVLVRPSLWTWDEPVQQQVARGVINTNVAQVQTTADFRLQPKDYLIRGDGSRWQAQSVEGEHLDTGFGTQAGPWNAVGFSYANVTREDESSPAYLLPLAESYIQEVITQYYSRAPVTEF
jgi:hypothetical protein